MDKDKTAVNTTDPAADQADVVTVVDDNEAKLAALETERAQLIEEAANYKLAFLKEKAKGRGEDFEEDEDSRIERITKKALVESKLADVIKEKDAVIAKALKENKELKLAHLNKNNPSAATGSHTESTPVRDTLVTPDQMSAFKARGWTEKDIERYKKNLRRYS